MSLQSQRELNLCDNRTEWICTLDDELFGVSKLKERKTKRMKREERKRRQKLEIDEQEEKVEVSTAGQMDFDRHDLDISAMELRVLQSTDPTLERARNEIKSGKNGNYFFRDDLLYNTWVRSGCEGTVEQLVLPQSYRGLVLQLAHSIPLAGHLSKVKTTNRILQRFYWPTVYRDVARYCRACIACQKASGRRPMKAPLIPLPIIAQPFSRIAMDIIGPLPKSRNGNRYVLVVCDYATRYPEAVALRSIDAATIAEELVKIFSRVGIPHEILTDQGANFTSQLLTELYRMLHIRPIRTTSYHPQTDGLVERFNHTLKFMLRKSLGGKRKSTKDWDVLLPYLLFAYREVPQASTGFSPFELLYGHVVRGPLDILSESWQGRKKSEESVVSHILTIRERLGEMKKMADMNLKKAQQQQKLWYDQSREFKKDDMVLLLLPTTTNKLLAKWQGPYRVIGRVGKANYLIDMPDHQKTRRIYHVNLLKKWESPILESCDMAKEVKEEEFPDWKKSELVQPVIGDQLSDMERFDLQGILDEFEDVLQGKPKQTTLVTHRINTTSEKPVRLPPYRIPHAYHESVTEELREMEVSGIIEPSNSEWSSPIVVVKKKDGNI